MKNRILIILSIFCFLLAFGCKKKDEGLEVTKLAAQPEGQAPVDPAAAAQAVAVPAPAPAAVAVAGDIMADILTVETNVSNSLLKYVPADTVVLLASTQAISSDSPAIKKIMLSYSEFFKSEEMTKSMDEILSEIEGNEEAKVVAGQVNIKEGMKFLLDEMLPLLKDYKPEMLEKFGLNPKVGIDSVLYMIGGQIVFKSTGIADVEKYKAWQTQVFEKFGLKVNDETVDGKSWQTFDIDGKITIAQNIEGEIATLSIGLTSDKATDLPAALKEATQAYSIESLKKLAGKGAVISVFTADLLTITNWVLGKGTPVERLMTLIAPEVKTSDLPKPCAEEITGIVKMFPRMLSRTYMRELANGSITVGGDYTLAIGDSQVLNSLVALKKDLPKLGISNHAGMASLSLGIDVRGTIEFMKSVGKRFADAPYQCELLTDLNGVSELQSSNIGPDNLTITALSAILEDLTLDETTKDPKTVKLRAALLGANLGSTLQAFAQGPGFETIKFENGVKGSYNLKDLGVNQILETIFTETGAYVANPESDVVAISQAGVEPSLDILNFSVSQSILKLIPSDTNDEELKALESLKFNVVSYGIGVNADGVYINGYINL